MTRDVRRQSKPRASRWRVMADLAFAMVMLLVVCAAILAGVFEVMYWTKMELGIDIFSDHLSDLFDFLEK
ncbi:MAG TPA: hypothetical protein PLD30_10665 [Candidatus Competibacteraceae bacterium]|nr:hypothetical protein [Candidatus Competibacteraceae bacterium]